MASFDRACLRVKRDLERYLPADQILTAAREAKHRWRRRLLDPVLTVQLFIVQVLHCNTSLTHLRHLAGSWTDKPVNPSAFCQARKRLPVALMRSLLATICRNAGATGLFHGYKLWIVDGTSASLGDTKALQKAYPQPAVQRPGCGFPLMKILALFDAATGMLVQMVPTSLHAHEQSQVAQLHPMLGTGDLLLGDRGFCSFWHLAMLQARQVHGLFRMHQRQIVNFKPHRPTRTRSGRRMVLAKSPLLSRVFRRFSLFATPCSIADQAVSN